MDEGNVRISLGKLLESKRSLSRPIGSRLEAIEVVAELEIIEIQSALLATS